MKSSDIEEVLSRPISDDLKLKVINILEAQEGERDKNALAKWNTPLAVALTGLITLSGNFIFDYMRGNATTQNTVTLEQVRAEVADGSNRLKSELDLTAKNQEAELAIRSEDKKFQFELIRNELAKPDTSQLERAQALLLLAKSGILDDLNVEALTELATASIKAVDPNADPSVPALASNTLSITPADLSPDSLAVAYAQTEPDPARLSDIKAVAESVTANKDAYVRVATALHAPWAVVGVIHQIDWGGDFGVTFKGTPLASPEPAATAGSSTAWSDSAKQDLAPWWGTTDAKNLGAVLDRIERYNGLGYRRRGVFSPFLWACSNLYTSGRYVSDGTFDATATTKFCGAATILKYLESDNGIDILAEQ